MTYTSILQISDRLFQCPPPRAAGVRRHGAHLLQIKRLSIEQGDTKSGGNRLRSAKSERSEQDEIYKISASLRARRS